MHINKSMYKSTYKQISIHIHIYDEIILGKPIGGGGAMVQARAGFTSLTFVIEAPYFLMLVCPAVEEDLAILLRNSSDYESKML